MVTLQSTQSPLKIKQQDPTSSAYNPRLSEEQWEAIRVDVLAQLEQHVSIADVLRQLKSKDIVVTRSQLDTQLKKWRFAASKPRDVSPPSTVPEDVSRSTRPFPAPRLRPLTMDDPRPLNPSGKSQPAGRLERIDGFMIPESQANQDQPQNVHANEASGQSSNLLGMRSSSALPWRIAQPLYWSLSIPGYLFVPTSDGSFGYMASECSEYVRCIWQAATLPDGDIPVYSFIYAAHLLMSMRCYTEACDIALLATTVLNTFTPDNNPWIRELIIFATISIRAAASAIHLSAIEPIKQRLGDWKRSHKQHLGTSKRVFKVTHLLSCEGCSLAADLLNDDNLADAATRGAQSTFLYPWEEDLMLFLDDKENKTPLIHDPCLLPRYWFVGDFVQSSIVRQGLLAAAEAMIGLLRNHSDDFDAVMKGFQDCTYEDGTQLQQAVAATMMEHYIKNRGCSINNDKLAQLSKYSRRFEQQALVAFPFVLVYFHLVWSCRVVLTYPLITVADLQLTLFRIKNVLNGDKKYLIGSQMIEIFLKHMSPRAIPPDQGSAHSNPRLVEYAFELAGIRVPTVSPPMDVSGCPSSTLCPSEDAMQPRPSSKESTSKKYTWHVGAWTPDSFSSNSDTHVQRMEKSDSSIPQLVTMTPAEPDETVVIEEPPLVATRGRAPVPDLASHPPSISPLADLMREEDETSSLSSGFRSFKALSAAIRGVAAIPARSMVSGSSNESSGHMSWDFSRVTGMPSGPSIRSMMSDAIMEDEDARRSVGDWP